MGGDRNEQNALVKRIVAERQRPYLPTSMLNDRSSTLSLLETRRSAKPRELVGPGPTPEEMERILTIAARVPDHGSLTPWRFVTVSDDQRDALADLLLKALAEDNSEATDAHREKEVNFAHYPGQLVVVVSAPVEDHKIPVWEQQLSCGAAGHEPPACVARARLCRRVGDGLARLFRAGAASLLRAGREDRRFHLHRPRQPRARRPCAARTRGRFARVGAACTLTSVTY